MLGSETERLALGKLERSNELFVCVRRYLGSSRACGSW